MLPKPASQQRKELKMSRNNQRGIAHLGILLLVVVVAAIGLVGWKVYEKQQTANAPATSQTETEASDVPQVNSASDLKEAEDYVRNTDVDGQLDTTEIDAALSEQLR